MTSKKLVWGFPPEAFEPQLLPDVDRKFVLESELKAFEKALNAPDPLNTSLGPTASAKVSAPPPPPQTTKRFSLAVGSFRDDASAVAAAARAVVGDIQPLQTPAHIRPLQTPAPRRELPDAQNNRTPANSKTYRDSQPDGSKKGEGAPLAARTQDEIGDGFFIQIARWPLFFFAISCLALLAAAYFLVRSYIYTYEYFFKWRGEMRKLRRRMQRTSNYREWVAAAKELDGYLGGQSWREDNSFAYYNWKTVKRVWDQMRELRLQAEKEESRGPQIGGGAAGDLKSLLEACVKYNFVGVDNPRLYSHTYYGTKNLVQNYIDEAYLSKQLLLGSNRLPTHEKRALFKHCNANYGRTALCLSGGAACAYYHIGVAKALLDADLLPDVITGTSGGALIASLLGTRTDKELSKLLVPAISVRIRACQEPITVWGPRYWKTGARFDSIDWARRCSWFTRGSMTFREAYERTGRILNISCVPSEPHSPTMLCNYLTSPDCVIWSAVLASAAVPGVLNPVVLMTKLPDGSLTPWAFGHRWKDGSLRTDVPIKALNTLFNVNFTVVSQVNPHINFFFFSSRGSIGHPVTQRKGKGWRGGYLVSMLEHFLKLDMIKWLKFVRHAEVLPRPMGQDWSQLWLQGFGGTVTILPQAVPSDFVYILSDPDSLRLARMIHEGQQSTFPKMKFIANRLRIGRLIEHGRQRTRPWAPRGSIQSIMSEEDLTSLLGKETSAMPPTPQTPTSATAGTEEGDRDYDDMSPGTEVAPADDMSPGTAVAPADDFPEKGLFVDPWGHPLQGAQV
ncbi:hypothetical protein HIM_06374 [Hirsutella minnesotensis 3608]|uniref:Patatin-like phospholipase domain-containing protein n=1 Tax=Hirsutella minnesotensis 3608 TaxID=1043627 RepID=A0A0F7ZU29_9HYPO|nr:hypothetical protein HIM_06374 [Hirsutella minnesotensis 3608]